LLSNANVPRDVSPRRGHRPIDDDDYYGVGISSDVRIIRRSEERGRNRFFKPLPPDLSDIGAERKDFVDQQDLSIELDDVAEDEDSWEPPPSTAWLLPNMDGERTIDTAATAPLIKQAASDSLHISDMESGQSQSAAQSGRRRKLEQVRTCPESFRQIMVGLLSAGFAEVRSRPFGTIVLLVILGMLIYVVVRTKR
jgi:hypothetical protein